MEHRTRLFPCLLIAVVYLTIGLSGQKLDVPGGSRVTHATYEHVTRNGRSGILRTIITNTAVSFHFRPDWNSPWSLIGAAPLDKHFGVAELESASGDVVFSCRGDGLIRQIILDDRIGTYHVIAEGLFLPPSGEAVAALLGMGQFIVTNKYIYRSTTGPTDFEIDTAGIADLFTPPRSTVVGVWHGQWAALAPNGDVYVLRFDWVLRRKVGEDRWTKVVRLPTDTTMTYGHSIYVDRRHRVYVSGIGRVWWMSGPDEPLVLHDDMVEDLALHRWQDDAVGNVYARTSEGRLLRSNAGTGRWEPIDGPILELTTDRIQIANSIDITESGYLVFTSAIGPFISSDCGNTWLHDVDGTSGSTVSGLVEWSPGSYVVGTSLGVFAKSPLSNTWTKTYPTAGYATVRSLQRDLDDVLWIQASGNVLNNGAPILSSTDGGATWNVNAVPLSETGAPTLYVNSDGTRYCALSTIDSTRGVMHRQERGGPWTLDTLGLSPDIKGPPLFGDDHFGAVYFGMRAGSNPGLWRRAPESGHWSIDSIGLGMPMIAALTSDKNGRMIAGVKDRGIMVRETGHWRTIPPPPPLGAGITAIAVSVDSSNAIYASFAIVEGLTHGARGTFMTTDDGATWTPISAGSYGARGIVSTPLKTYVLADDDVYPAIASTYTTAVTDRNDLPRTTIVVDAFPNPFNPEITIQYVLPEESEVRLCVVDILGREIAVIHEGIRRGGLQTVRWSPGGSGGIYFLKLRAQGQSGASRTTSVKKVVYMR